MDYYEQGYIETMEKLGQGGFVRGLGQLLRRGGAGIGRLFRGIAGPTGAEAASALRKRIGNIPSAAQLGAAENAFAGLNRGPSVGRLNAAASAFGKRIPMSQSIASMKGIPSMTYPPGYFSRPQNIAEALRKSYKRGVPHQGEISALDFQL